MATRRALHFVLKIGNRKQSIDFFKDTLGMKILRHEEFEEGCKASCNGPYDGRWSKTMVGYGSEDKHFVVELTYNYGVSGYALGNDFRGFTIKSRDLYTKNGGHLQAPDGYSFNIVNEDKKDDPVSHVTLSVSNISKSYEYWVGLLGMTCYERTSDRLLLGYSDDQAHLELIETKDNVDHAKAFGRIAFACPREQLPELQACMKKQEQTILTELVSLDTPGKSTVDVVILADPDGHEICFVGDEAFRELSQVDETADDLLSKAIAADKSDEWYMKHKIAKEIQS
ncbi:glyoxalase domain-containing protein 4-like [Watersipora subatra]|uniref:glyoxalase domain-containing protein 4-like n=1 Tax=Watersipora subatra TaxID=2589382 RepID=UPI00355C004B